MPRAQAGFVEVFEGLLAALLKMYRRKARDVDRYVAEAREEVAVAEALVGEHRRAVEGVSRVMEAKDLSLQASKAQNRALMRELDGFRVCARARRAVRMDRSILLLFIYLLFRFSSSER